MCYNQDIMKRFILTILALFAVLINTLIFTPAFGAQTFTQKELTVVTQDGFTLKANLKFKKDKTIKDYPTVVLIHSLGYNSQWWGDLPSALADNGFAVLTIDLRGHGASVYNAKLNKVSWTSLTNSAYKKYPDDVIKVVQAVKDEYPKKTFFNNWAIIGSDLGASTGIIAADKLKEKPRTIVMLSPVVQARGLYTPVSIAQLDNVDFLSITGEYDLAALEAEKYLKKFAQGDFSTYTSASKSAGMVMLKNDPNVKELILGWINKYLKPQPEITD